ncbi:hypothetical protein BT93_F0673 [Corymbia citriodora subsp. variegata]|nr:hypothetical protein BT93_F0673 [Corymbia citriodora subsp. variegata]
MGENETDGTSPVDGFQLKPGNSECFETTRNGTQMRDRMIGQSDIVNGCRTRSMENRKKEKDESGEFGNQNDVVRSSCQRCKGVEHHESSCKVTIEVEDEGDLSSVKRNGTVETDRIPTKTGTGSGTGRTINPGRDQVERGGGRGIASISRNNKGSRSASATASTSGKGKASNSGRSISSISPNSATLSSRMGRGKGTALSLGRDTILSLGRDIANTGSSSSSGRGIVSSSQSSFTLSTGRYKGKGASVNSGKGTILSLGRGTTTMGARLISGINKGSSRRGRGSTSEKHTTVSSGGDMTSSLGRGTTKMGMDKGSNSAKTGPQTSSS